MKLKTKLHIILHIELVLEYWLILQCLYSFLEKNTAFILGSLVWFLVLYPSCQYRIKHVDKRIDQKIEKKLIHQRAVDFTDLQYMARWIA